MFINELPEWIYWMVLYPRRCEFDSVLSKKVTRNSSKGRTLHFGVYWVLRQFGRGIIAFMRFHIDVCIFNAIQFLWSLRLLHFFYLKKLHRRARHVPEVTLKTKLRKIFLVRYASPVRFVKVKLVVRSSHNFPLTKCLGNRAYFRKIYLIECL